MLLLIRFSQTLEQPQVIAVFNEVWVIIYHSRSTDRDFTAPPNMIQ